MGQPLPARQLHFSDPRRTGGCDAAEDENTIHNPCDQQAYEGGRRTARDWQYLDLYGPAFVCHGVEAGGNQYCLYLGIAGASGPQNDRKLPGQLREGGTGKKCEIINKVLRDYGCGPKQNSNKDGWRILFI